MNTKIKRFKQSCNILMYFPIIVFAYSLIHNENLFFDMLKQSSGIILFALGFALYFLSVIIISKMKKNVSKDNGRVKEYSLYLLGPSFILLIVTLIFIAGPGFIELLSSVN